MAYRLQIFFQKIFSIPVFRSAVLIPRLEIVMPFAEALPVRPIPEQGFIPSVRDDMVHHSSFHIPSLCHALDTQGIGFQVLFPRLLPCPVVAAAPRRAYFLRVESFVLLTVLCTGFYQFRTAGMTAGRSRTPGHYCSQGSPAFPKCPRELTRL